MCSSGNRVSINLLYILSPRRQLHSLSVVRHHDGSYSEGRRTCLHHFWSRRAVPVIWIAFSFNAGGSPPVAARHQVRKEHGPRNTRLRSGLYIDNAQGAPRRDEQNPLGGDPTRDYVLSSDGRQQKAERNRRCLRAACRCCCYPRSLSAAGAAAPAGPSTQTGARDNGTHLVSELFVGFLGSLELLRGLS